MGVGATVWNTLKGGRTEKSGGEINILKRGDKLGQGMGALKRGGGAGTTLRTMVFENIWCIIDLEAFSMDT